MHCSGCGKQIPFSGQVCPYCQRDKSSDRAQHTLGVVAMLLGGWIGGMVGGFTGTIVGALGLGSVAVVIAAATTRNAAHLPPEVRLAPSRDNATYRPSVQGRSAASKAPAMMQSADELTGRLRRLNNLKAEGLLTDAEYAEQRRAIIKGV